ncbi:MULTISPECIES: HNH endonuclease [Cytobacillus]|uniref:HNH endonuclease n=1 Tax=Cytobacillus TaxID=2675230 RepID=UPI0020410CAA|nr:HNH endonuclease signature motif containing protein [Cytobacillus oceanisediminis]MCM3243163.1 HNH endonuclease [Cytobacillus oceanisediminis]MDK7665406.1 HNH endonuclease signature motif containing protein [Cytobacillus oceanisediminis]
MGWDLKVGEIKSTYITDEDIWKVINNFFSRSYTTMSYKYGFFKTLIENLYNVNEDLELDFNKLFYSFAKIYWNLVVHHQLWQSNNKKQASSIQKILVGYCDKYSIPPEWTFDKLDDKVQLEIITDIKKTGKRYVIGAFYGDTKGLFYKFDRNKEYLKFNLPVYKFLQRHQKMITYLTNYHLALFLEKHNSVPNINYLLTKIENVSKRSSLNPFYQILLKYQENVCFYCRKSLDKKRNASHVDHFIPWSFVQSDNLWNLVLSCPSCNLKKNDNLAEKSFLYQIVERNEHLINSFNPVDIDLFSNYQHEKLVNLYNYSSYNGYIDGWKPKV